MHKYKIDDYTTESGNSPFKRYMKALAKKHQIQDISQIKLYLDRLEEYGAEVDQQWPETTRKLKDEIYELRPPNHRVVFFFFDGDTIVLLHVFKKQHEKAPKNEIEKAKKEMEDYKRRHNNE